MKKLLVFLLIIPFFTITCYAEELYDSAAEDLGVYSVEQGLSGEEKEISGELDLSGDYDTGGALSRLWKSLLEKISAAIKAEWKSVFVIAAISFTDKRAFCLNKSRISSIALPPKSFIYRYPFY